MPPLVCCSRAQSDAPCSVEALEHTVRRCSRDPVTVTVRHVTFSPSTTVCTGASAAFAAEVAVDGLAGAVAGIAAVDDGLEAVWAEAVLALASISSAQVIATQEGKRDGLRMMASLVDAPAGARNVRRLCVCTASDRNLTPKKGVAAAI